MKIDQVWMIFDLYSNHHLKPLHSPAQVECPNVLANTVLASSWIVKLARLNSSTWVIGAAAALVMGVVHFELETMLCKTYA